MYLNPLSSCYQQDSWSHVFTSCSNPTISSKLHPSLNGFFQCFLYAPKLLSTLRMGEVSIQAKNLLRMCRQRSRSKGNFREMVQMIVGKQSLTLKCLDRVFSLKNFFGKNPFIFYFLFLFFTISWVTRVYIVLVKVCEKAHSNLSGREFRGSLATWPELRMTHKIQLGKDSSNSSMCFSHGLFMSWHLQASRELVVNSSSSQNLHQSLTHNPYIIFHKNIGK